MPNPSLPPPATETELKRLRSPDKRFSISRTFTGAPRPQHVVWFCGDFRSAHNTIKEAREARRLLRLAHYRAITSLGTGESERAQVLNPQTPGPLVALSSSTIDAQAKSAWIATIKERDSDGERAANQALLMASYNAFDKAGRTLGVSAEQLAQSLDVVRVIRFLDGLSDMVEGGRLKREDIPDDYAWLVERLAEINGPLPVRSNGEDKAY